MNQNLFSNEREKWWQEYNLVKQLQDRKTKTRIWKERDIKWRNKRVDITKFKKTAQVMNYNSQNFHWLKKTRAWMDYDWIAKLLRKEFHQKNWEKSKIEAKMPHVNKKSVARKRFFSNTALSLYIKIRMKTFHAAELLAFSLHSLFRLDQNHHSKLTSKIVKMCEQILK